MRTLTGLIAFALLALLLTGCPPAQQTETTETESAAPEEEATETTRTTPADYFGAMGQARRSAEATAQTTTLNQAIRTYEAVEGSHPTSLQELVSEGYLPAIPDAPRGFRWAYDPATGQVSLEETR
ncbi:MAG: hypothetical protein EA425_09465 [Puniceicoccaceae bacterium]|nr:MAG: hypothetical protein EA425_09465 [Puniceicoccaceae bacterium]